MRNSAVHICQFSTLDELSERKYGNPEEVWQFVKGNEITRASSFEMTQSLYNSLLELDRHDFIKLTHGPYPWITWDILL